MALQEESSHAICAMQHMSPWLIIACHAGCSAPGIFHIFQLCAACLQGSLLQWHVRTPSPTSLEPCCSHHLWNQTHRRRWPVYM